MAERESQDCIFPQSSKYCLITMALEGTLETSYSNPCHFMNKEKGSEGLSDFLRVTELKAPSGNRTTLVRRPPKQETAKEASSLCYL